MKPLRTLNRLDPTPPRRAVPPSVPDEFKADRERRIRQHARRVSRDLGLEPRPPRHPFAFEPETGQGLLFL